MKNYFSFWEDLAEELMNQNTDKLDFTKKEDVEKLHDTVDELKSYDLFSTFFGDEYTKFLDSNLEKANSFKSFITYILSIPILKSQLKL